MKTSHLLQSLAVLLFCAFGALAQPSQTQRLNGKIIEQAPYVLPTYEQLPDDFKRTYSKEAVEAIRNSKDLELVKIKYMSEGLKIVGFIYKPRKTEGKKLPVIIFNRGGLANGTIGPENFNYIYEMNRYASEGFVVLASQYRGAGGSEGKDEVAGADTDDVMALLILADGLGYADMNRLFMWGYSRGAMMTLQAIRRSVVIRAAAIVGAPTDLTQNLNDPGFVGFARETYPDFDARKDEHIKSRSAVFWVDKIRIPLLIMNGGADPGVSPASIMTFAQKLEEQGKVYELVIYARDDHRVSRNAEDRLRRTIDWFKNVRTMPIVHVIGKVIRDEGVEAGLKFYHELKKAQPDAYDFSEPELNTLGYLLLGEKRIKEAIEVFKLNVSIYPNAFNTYDSLGEAYHANNERELAIENYKKSLELNPRNSNATDVLKRIGVQ